MYPRLPPLHEAFEDHREHDGEHDRDDESLHRCIAHYFYPPFFKIAEISTFQL
jgi:hypothetical protein